MQLLSGEKFDDVISCSVMRQVDRIAIAYTTLAGALHDIDSKGKGSTALVAQALGPKLIQV